MSGAEKSGRRIRSREEHFDDSSLRRFKADIDRSSKGEARVAGSAEVKDRSFLAIAGEALFNIERSSQRVAISDMNSEELRRADNFDVRAVDTKTGREVGEAHKVGPDRMKVSVHEDGLWARIFDSLSEIFARKAGSGKDIPQPANDFDRVRALEEYEREFVVECDVTEAKMEPELQEPASNSMLSRDFENGAVIIVPAHGVLHVDPISHENASPPEQNAQSDFYEAVTPRAA